ncbi:MAG: VWA domain-containing protein [Candidatus Eisenbacteria sp.]|nr:VWA domain-containing protein [Candidatus Eisenbacteria bacterium]
MIMLLGMRSRRWGAAGLLIGGLLGAGLAAQAALADEAGPSATVAAATMPATAPEASASSTGASTSDGDRAGEFPEVMFILDASGSMWGDAGGETKIAAARRVLGEIVPALPAEITTGLTVYGHRHKGDCGDVEIILPAGNADRDALIERAAEISPKGKTPIAASIRTVVEALKSREAETTIILISDGKETCDADPCAVVADLKATGIQFVLHVVGFDVTEEERDELACLAAAGGGRYFGAPDAGTLLAAFESVEEELIEKVEHARMTAKPATTRLGKLHITLPATSTVSLAQIRIVRTNDGQTVKTVTDPGAESMHPLLADEYELILGYANPNYRPPTEVSCGAWPVVGGETTEVVFGAVAFDVAPELDDMSIEAVVLSHNENTEMAITLEEHDNGYYLFKPKPVLPGVYRFAIQYYRSPQATQCAENIVVGPGEETTVALGAGITLLPPAAGGVTGWDLVPAAGDQPALMVRRGWDNQEPLWRKFAVAPGIYSLQVHLDGMDEPLPVGDGIRIAQGDLIEFETGF